MEFCYGATEYKGQESISFNRNVGHRIESFISLRRFQRLGGWFVESGFHIRNANRRNAISS